MACDIIITLYLHFLTCFDLTVIEVNVRCHKILLVTLLNNNIYVECSRSVRLNNLHSGGTRIEFGPLLSCFHGSFQSLKFHCMFYNRLRPFPFRSHELLESLHTRWNSFVCWSAHRNYSHKKTQEHRDKHVVRTRCEHAIIVWRRSKTLCGKPFKKANFNFDSEIPPVFLRPKVSRRWKGFITLICT
jgi:hypothetical protein